jgi:hypothetical protein
MTDRQTGRQTLAILKWSIVFSPRKLFEQGGNHPRNCIAPQIVTTVTGGRIQAHSDETSKAVLDTGKAGPSGSSTEVVVLLSSERLVGEGDVKTRGREFQRL